MHKILIDTSVWLDLAKSNEQKPLLDVIEELVKHNELSLIMPKIIVAEFDRNKQRIIKESSQSLSHVFRRVKDVVDKLADPKKKKSTIQLLNDIDYKIPSLGENVLDSILRVEKLIKNANIIETSNEILLRAAQRGIDKKAPFHLQKNSINDSIIIETYAACLNDRNHIRTRFAFITHNKNDFSMQNGNAKIPHPDIAMLFSKIKSRYYIKLAEAIYKVRPELVTEIMLENESIEEPRSLTEILEAEDILLKKIWYNRHQNWLYKIQTGKHKIVDKILEGKYSHSETPKDIYDGARKSAKKVERELGIENLGPWDDFEWGMMNGKLSALRWVTGEEWDMLDT